MGKVITFYSYKGGTGRSMLLANVAWLLASNSERVLVIDWDLEAPGLHRYFKPFLVDPDMAGTDGLIDVVWMLATKALTHETRDGLPPSTRSPSIADVADRIDLEDYTSPLKWEFPSTGGIDFIGAGRQGATYSERVNTFDWKRFYQMGGGRWLDRMKATWTKDYDFVLIDSRTGVSDTSGICTMQLPDALVACLTLNRQSIEGVAAVLHAVRTWRTAPGGPSMVERQPIELYPVVTRIEMSEQRKLDLARKLARELLQPFLPASERYPRRYWDEMEITYRPFYAYEEVLAAFGDEVGVAASAKSLTSETEGIGRRIVGRANLAMQGVTDADRKRVLANYALGTEPQLDGRDAGVTAQLASSRQDSDFLRGILAKEVRWRRGGYGWRDLLTRRELQLITAEDRTKFGREMSFYHQNSELLSAFREKTNRWFLVLWLGTLAPAALVGGLRLVFSRGGYRPSDWGWGWGWQFLTVAQTLAPAIAVLFLLLYVIAVGIISRSPRTPYGIRFSDVMRLSFFGPFGSPSRDFEPTDSRP